MSPSKFWDKFSKIDPEGSCEPIRMTTSSSWSWNSPVHADVKKFVDSENWVFDLLFLQICANLCFIWDDAKLQWSKHKSVCCRLEGVRPSRGAHQLTPSWCQSFLGLLTGSHNWSLSESPPIGYTRTSLRRTIDYLVPLPQAIGGVKWDCVVFNYLDIKRSGSQRTASCNYK